MIGRERCWCCWKRGFEASSGFGEWLVWAGGGAELGGVRGIGAGLDAHER